MDPVTYCQHIRRVLLNEEMARIDAMTDAQTMDLAFKRAKEVDPDLKRSAFDGALKEGMTPVEINHILELDMKDPLEDIESLPELDSDELADTISGSFSDIFELFLDKPGACIAMSYCYFDDEDSLTPDQCRGNVVAYGEKATIMAMIKDMQSKMRKFTDKNGFIDSNADIPKDDDA